MNPQAYAARVVAQVILGKNLEDAISHLPADIKQLAFIKELSYGTLRHYHQLNGYLPYLLNKSKKLKPIPRATCLIGIYQLLYSNIPDYAGINETVNAMRHLKHPYLAPLTNAVLRNFQRKKIDILIHAEKNDSSIRYSHPPWLISQLKKSWREKWRTICTANNQKPPLNLRVNTQRISRADYLAKLNAEKIEASLNPYSPSGIQLRIPCSVEDIPGFNQGLCSVQDEGAQLAIKFLDLAPKQRVLDACAAPGGKACHILETYPDIELTAVEKEAARTGKIISNFKRLGLSGNILTGDATHPQKWWDKKLFDRILVDAPCSGTGVIRRHPDIKLLRRQEDIAKFSTLQIQLLNALWPLLRIGGIMVYGTCSILPDENEGVINTFIRLHKNISLRFINLSCGVRLRYGYQLLPTSPVSSDGFYYAILEKTNETIYQS